MCVCVCVCVRPLWHVANADNCSSRSCGVDQIAGAVPLTSILQVEVSNIFFLHEEMTGRGSQSPAEQFCSVSVGLQ